MTQEVIKYSQGYFNKHGDLRRLGETLDSVDNNFSDEWDKSNNYKSGNLVIYNNILFKAKTDNIGVAPTDADTWEPMSVSSLINNLANRTSVMEEYMEDVSVKALVDSGRFLKDDSAVSFIRIGSFDMVRDDLPFRDAHYMILTIESGKGWSNQYARIVAYDLGSPNIATCGKAGGGWSGWLTMQMA